MSESKSKIRNIARGIITKEHQVLLIEVESNDSRWWILPGGGQDFGETIEQTLTRECEEELGIGVEIKDFVMLREFVGPNRSETVGGLGNKHFVEYYFTLRALADPDLNTREDTHRQIRWVDAHEVRSLKFFPKTLADKLPAIAGGIQDFPIYVGDAD